MAGMTCRPIRPKDSSIWTWSPVMCRTITCSKPIRRYSRSCCTTVAGPPVSSVSRPAIALGKDRVHHRGRVGVVVADEDVAAQHGQRAPTGASRRLAIRLELLLQFIRWSVLAREPAVTQPSCALGGGPHGARNPE